MNKKLGHDAIYDARELGTPRRFLFIRWGTKALRQEIISSNPHTRIVYSEYIRIER